MNLYEVNTQTAFVMLVMFGDKHLMDFFIKKSWNASNMIHKAFEEHLLVHLLYYIALFCPLNKNYSALIIKLSI